MDNIDTYSTLSKNELIKNAINFQLQGKTSEAEKCYLYLIKKGNNDPIILCNYGIFLKSIGRLKEAEKIIHQAIKLKPNFDKAYFNLGLILIDLKELNKAELSIRKAIELNPSNEQAYLSLGWILKYLGKLKESESSIRKAIELNSSYPKSHLTLAIILLSKGELKEAELYARKAIEIKPDYIAAYINLVNILKLLKKIDEAELYARKAVELNSSYAKSHLNLAIILLSKGELKEAELYARKAIELDPNYAQAYLSLGTVLKDLGKLKEAELYTKKAIELNPNNAKAHSNLGTILKLKKEIKQAEISTKKAIQINPKLAEAYSNLSSILHELGQIQEAEINARQAIKIKPDLAEAYNNLGNVLNSLGQTQEAEISIRKAIQLQPDSASAHLNLGVTLKNLGQLQESELSTLKSISLEPDNQLALFNLSLVNLLKGDYKAGLEHYELRVQAKGPESLFWGANPIIKRVDNQKLEKGESILVVSEQALGDVIMHMRYLIPLRNQGLNISFCAPEKLHSLIKDSGIHSHPLSPEQSNLVKEGQWIPLLSLLKYLSISPQNPPIDTPYISSTEILKEKWRNILCKEKRPIIGINWQGSKKMESTYLGRSIPLNKFAKIVEKNDISLISFQKGFGSEQMEKCSFKEHFVNCQDQIDEIWDYSETAAIIENCDLIITNDCSLGPLAAGIGKKVWLLLRDSPFWYWGLQGERTFWYPTMKLFRQKELHNWDEVIERVSTALQKEIRDKYKQDE